MNPSPKIGTAESIADGAFATRFAARGVEQVFRRTRVIYHIRGGGRKLAGRAEAGRFAIVRKNPVRFCRIFPGI
ncbi:MAG TPA: hypothetical protein DDZ83_00240 [Nitrospinae bacterium]|nr:hypothetical protein [Nitrospinota bacterium]